MGASSRRRGAASSQQKHVARSLGPGGHQAFMLPSSSSDAPQPAGFKGTAPHSARRPEMPRPPPKRRSAGLRCQPRASKPFRSGGAPSGPRRASYSLCRPARLGCLLTQIALAHATMPRVQARPGSALHEDVSQIAQVSAAQLFWLWFLVWEVNSATELSWQPIEICPYTGSICYPEIGVQNISLKDRKCWSIWVHMSYRLVYDR